MMGAAAKVQAGSADQYVLLKIARDVAAGTGDAATALQAAERLLEQFDESAADLIGETLLTAAREATTSAQHKAVAEAALSFAGKLADADQYETALRVCEAARSSAQRAKLYPLAKELTAQIEEIKRQQRLSEEYRKALSTLEDKPTDPEANLAAGRHLCFVKSSWDRGIPMLALGSDTALKAAAIKDLRGAKSAEEQAAIGDAWWDAAETKQGEERDTLRLRAGYWYRQAEPKLAEGLAALKIEQRLEEIAKLGRERQRTTAPPVEGKTAKGMSVVNRSALVDWLPLFNGKNLDGWHLLPGPPVHAQVADGVLTLLGGSVRTPGYLCTDRGDYRDFHLRAELRASQGGNSGFWLHAPSIYSRGMFTRPYEATILDVNAGYIFTVVNGLGRELVKGRNVTPGDWYTLDTIVKGNSITTHVNGVECGTCVDSLGRLSPTGGHIYIENAGGIVQFRKIQIKIITD